MFYTSLLMRMFHWDHGLLDLMSSILMIRDYVVADHLIVSRRPKLAMLVLLPLIRAAVEFASMLMRLKRFISSAGKERMLCGMLLSNGTQHPVFFLTQEDGMHGESSNTKSFFCSLMKRKENIIRDSETPLKMGGPLQY
ncbi:hypothetical protein Godav_013835 [Gossypium davidsonii]|uniref:Uncharacterized protein n=1 Tax=Gossypium davidsonii TaxID=34287 RepID=A0A7J8RHV4_GOSDV|nr:hypothetical protein [Gossypium davidsonii]